MTEPARHPLILASASPRRQELLASMGYRFLTVPADIDETPLAAESPADHVLRLAVAKAAAVHQRHSDALVLAADTIVTHAGLILGKPRDAADALRMLSELSGTEHQVLTAIALQSAAGQLSFLSDSMVRFRELSAAEIRAYVASGEPLDKAGSYGIQGGAGVFVEHISGSYTGIMGLPLCQTDALLRQIGAEPDSK